MKTWKQLTVTILEMPNSHVYSATSEGTRVQPLAARVPSSDRITTWTEYFPSEIHSFLPADRPHTMSILWLQHPILLWRMLKESKSMVKLWKAFQAINMQEKFLKCFQQHTVSVGKKTGESTDYLKEHHWKHWQEAEEVLPWMIHISKFADAW